MSNKRISYNTAFLYFRMIFLMGIGFFTTREILEALGVEDLGIFNVVGSLIIMFDFVSSGLSNATQRFLNIGLGKNDLLITRQYFSQSLVIHIILAIIIAVFAETIGIWIIKNKLVIPVNRLDAAISIAHLSVLSLFFRFIKSCYDSDIIAREKMAVYAYLSIFEGIGKLIICYLLINNNMRDNLIFYVLLLLLLNILMTFFCVIYCSWKFKETHIKFYDDRSVYKQLLSFIGINSFGVLSWALGKQGINVVINLYLGASVNGAKALASQLDRIIAQFATNIDMAVKPQITKLYAQGRYNEMIELSHKSSKYIFYIAFILSVPFLFQTENILIIWLNDVPQFTVMFVQLLIVEVLCNIIGIAYNNLSMAIGKIKNIQIYGRLLTLAGLPISFIVLKYWKNPYIPVVIMTILTFIYSLYMVFETNRYLKFGIVEYLKSVLLPILKVVFLVCLGAYFIVQIIVIQNSLLSLFIVSAVLFLYAAIVIYIFGIDVVDKEQCKTFVLSRFKK